MMAASLESGPWATFWSMQAVFPHMRDQHYGRIVNFCSLNMVTGAWYSRRLQRGQGRDPGADPFGGARVGSVRHHGERDRAGARRRRATSRSRRTHRRRRPRPSRRSRSQRMGDPEEDLGGVALVPHVRRRAVHHRAHALRRRRRSHGLGVASAPLDHARRHRPLRARVARHLDGRLVGAIASGPRRSASSPFATLPPDERGSASSTTSRSGHSSLPVPALLEMRPAASSSVSSPCAGAQLDEHADPLAERRVGHRDRGAQRDRGMRRRLRPRPARR